jgi:arylsulfatase A-like enzyme
MLATSACVPGATAPDSSDSPPLGTRAAGANVVLITVDTLRADRLGVHGAAVATPVIDGLAEAGARFSAAYSTAPLTLPAHTSIMTGTYPASHGVRDNVGYRVDTALDTLAERLRDQNYRTGAFVSAFVLDASWGIDQGFDTYFDEFDTGGASRIMVGGGEAGLERRADEVVDRASEWLAAGNDRPFFLWVHLFDPHAPYDAPEPYGSRYADTPYVGEIAFTDAQIGRLLESVTAADGGRQTVVALVGDHGEGLGEHGEVQHGLFVYDESIHVPMIFSGAGVEATGLVRDEVVSLVDVAPTLLDLVGGRALQGAQGVSLVPRLDSAHVPAARAVYSESLYGRLHFGWSELRSLTEGRYKLIESSEPELYDLDADRDESINLVGDLNTVYARLASDLTTLQSDWADAGAGAGRAEVDAGTRARLEALGYVGSVRDIDSSADEVLPSPRAQIDVYNLTLSARSALNAGALPAAENLLREALEVDSALLEAQRMLGDVLVRQQRHGEAAAVYRAAVPLSPQDPEAHLLLADTLIAVGDFAGARRALEGGQELAPPSADIEITLGMVHAQTGNLPAAGRAFETALDLRPDSAHAHSGLAQVKVGLGDTVGAREHADAALAIDPAMPRAHFVLAEAARREGEIERAAMEYAAELVNDPSNLLAGFNLAMAYRELGRTADELAALRGVVKVAPAFPPGSLMFGRALLEAGIELETARRALERSLEGQLADPQRLLAYRMLAEVTTRLSDHAAATRWAALADQLSRGVGQQ